MFLGAERREHEDLEIAVPQERFGEIVDALTGFELFVVGGPPGRAWPLAHAGDAVQEHHQTWVRDPATELWRLDIFREPSRGGEWVCRRDARIRLPYNEVIARTGDGIPYARPEIVLLFKAKATRPKDDDDFAAALPRLEPAARDWLAAALELVHPGHHWLDTLS